MHSSFFDDVSEEETDSEYGECMSGLMHPGTSDYQWLLSTIEDLCNDANKPYRFDSIKREMEERGLLPENVDYTENENSTDITDPINRAEQLQSPFNQVYNPIGLAGEGAFGKILKVHNLIDKQNYAIKQIELEESEIPYAVREVQFLAHLNSPRVVRYYSSWLEQTTTGYRLSIQMEFINGDSLAHILSSGHKFTREESTKLVAEFALALSEIHSRGIIHRDFRPDNLMIRSEGGIAVVDFGISAPRNSHRRQFSDQQDFEMYHVSENLQPLSQSAPSAPFRIGSFSPKPIDRLSIHAADQKYATLLKVGTPLYSSPRQLNGEKGRCKDDMYSLGIVYFELLGQFKTNMEKAKAIRSLRTQRELPKGFLEMMPEESQIILQLTDPDSKKRPSAELLLTNPLFKGFKKTLGTGI